MTPKEFETETYNLIRKFDLECQKVGIPFQIQLRNDNTDHRIGFHVRLVTGQVLSYWRWLDSDGNPQAGQE